MNNTEMLARIATIPARILAGAYADILAGNGGSTILCEWTVTRKQVNALFAWHTRYGKTFPEVI